MDAITTEYRHALVMFVYLCAVATPWIPWRDL